MADIRTLDPRMVMDAIDRKTFNPASRKSEVVSYYRRPNKGTQANWIVWGDTQPGKRDDMVYRGFTPLFGFGRIHDGNDEDGRLFQRYGPWGPILSRPNGPAQFPVDQVITYRWYRPENVGSPAQGYEPMDHVRFTQLNDYIAAGNTIREYTCPDCESMTYLQPVHLARHLRNSHDWDRADILSWGGAMGIDFSKEFRPKVVSYDYAVDIPAPLPETSAAPVFVEKVQTPTLQQARQSGSKGLCIFCSKAKKGYCKKHVPEAVSA